MFARTVRTLAISGPHATSSFQGSFILIAGALGATLLGAGAALQFDSLIAVGRWLTLPVGQEVLVSAVVTAGLTGFLVWVACVLTVRAISVAALRPYHRLADRLERLIDGDMDDLADLHGPVIGVRRLARSIFVFQERLLESRQSEARLQRRYDALCQEQADERRLLLGMLAGRTIKATSPPPEPDAAPNFEMPAPPQDPVISTTPAPSLFVGDLLGPLHPPRPKQTPGKIQHLPEVCDESDSYQYRRNRRTA